MVLFDSCGSNYIRKSPDFFIVATTTVVLFFDECHKSFYRSNHCGSTFGADTNTPHPRQTTGFQVIGYQIEYVLTFSCFWQLFAKYKILPSFSNRTNANSWTLSVMYIDSSTWRAKFVHFSNSEKNISNSVGQVSDTPTNSFIRKGSFLEFVCSLLTQHEFCHYFTGRQYQVLLFICLATNSAIK